MQFYRLLFVAILLIVQQTCYSQLLLSSEEYDALPKIETKGKPGVLASMPRSRILPSPPPGYQNGLGSCSAWATAYAAMGVLYYNGWKHDWKNLARSPQFVYNQTKTFCDSGVYIPKVLGFLNGVGACSMRLMPYRGIVDCWNKPSLVAYDDAIRYRITWGAIPRKELTQVEVYKQQISMGYPIVIVIRVTRTYREQWEKHGWWTSDVVTSEDRHTHALCVVGYDDDRQALRIQNSDGTWHGDGGFFWMSYSLVEQGKILESYVLERPIHPCPWIPELCYPFSLVGPETLCPGATNYFFTTSSDLYGARWQVQGPARIVSANSKSATLEPTGTGLVLLTASAPNSSSCGYRLLWAGKPKIDLRITNYPALGQADSIKVSLPIPLRHQRVFPFEWKVYYSISAKVAKRATELLVTPSPLTEGRWSCRGHAEATNGSGTTKSPEFKVESSRPFFSTSTGDDSNSLPAYQLSPLSPTGEVQLLREGSREGDSGNAPIIPLWLVTTPSGLEMLRAQGDRVSLATLPRGAYVVTAIVGGERTSRTVVW